MSRFRGGTTPSPFFSVPRLSRLQSLSGRLSDDTTPTPNHGPTNHRFRFSFTPITIATKEFVLFTVLSVGSSLVSLVATPRDDRTRDP